MVEGRSCFSRRAVAPATAPTTGGARVRDVRCAWRRRPSPTCQPNPELDRSAASAICRGYHGMHPPRQGSAFLIVLGDEQSFLCPDAAPVTLQGNRPPLSPRFPFCNAMSMAIHVSRDSSTLPDVPLGQVPCAPKCESAHWRICPSVKLGGKRPMLTPRFIARNLAKDVPARSPQEPVRRARSMPCHVLRVPPIDPPAAIGHFPYFA
jgi:hypothetical protein